MFTVLLGLDSISQAQPKQKQLKDSRPEENSEMSIVHSWQRLVVNKALNDVLKAVDDNDITNI